MWAQDFAPYHKKYVAPYVDMALMAFSFMANLGALCVIVGGVLEFGFELTNKLIRELDLVYFWAWSMFLIERVGRIILTKPGKRKSAFSFLGWIINGLLMLTLIPIIVEFFKIDHNIGLISILGNREAHLLILFLIALIELSNTVITSMGRKTNPALAMAVSFMFIILAGSGLLLMPRCIQPGVHLSWIDSLFTATSAVCVTGLTTIDVPSTFTSFGQMVIIMLIQVGGLGIMTITSFFALFFMSNTSIYSQMLVRDMVSSKSLASLWSTLLKPLFEKVPYPAVFYSLFYRDKKVLKRIGQDIAYSQCLYDNGFTEDILVRMLKALLQDEHNSQFVEGIFYVNAQLFVSVRPEKWQNLFYEFWQRYVSKDFTVLEKPSGISDFVHQAISHLSDKSIVCGILRNCLLRSLRL